MVKHCRANDLRLARNQSVSEVYPSQTAGFEGRELQGTYSQLVISTVEIFTCGPSGAEQYKADNQDGTR